jgi:hypothetical protein
MEFSRIEKEGQHRGGKWIPWTGAGAHQHVPTVQERLLTI